MPIIDLEFLAKNFGPLLGIMMLAIIYMYRQLQKQQAKQLQDKDGVIEDLKKRGDFWRDQYIGQARSYAEVAARASVERRAT
jgi:hypothetical protein